MSHKLIKKCGYLIGGLGLDSGNPYGYVYLPSLGLELTPLGQQFFLVFQTSEFEKFSLVSSPINANMGQSFTK